MARNIREEFPNKKGYSSQNLWYMRQFYLEHKPYKFLQQVVGEIPWGQNITIFSKIKNLILELGYRFSFFRNQYKKLKKLRKNN